MTDKIVQVGDILIGNHLPMVLISGPCALESRDHAFTMAGELRELCAEYDIPFIFKTSFSKENRTSASSPTGLGLDKALEIFADLRKEYNLDIVTDVHEPYQCDIIKPFVSLIQIPAFLCRQSQLLKAAAETGLPVQIKKGQWMSGIDTQNIIKKMSAYGNDQSMLVERGNCFGYNNLVVDMVGVHTMKQFAPVIIDATHSVAVMGGKGDKSSGNRDMAPIIAYSALTVGIAGVFAECHDTPENAISDADNQIRLSDMERIVYNMMEVDSLAKRLLCRGTPVL
jgi:2-dehydro-3-deoxyphosphooctonate aldolase (KDO 8-P synthase)